MASRRDQRINPQAWFERRQYSRDKKRGIQLPMGRKVGYSAHKSFSKTLRGKPTL